jgi:hypothetical protein
VLIDICQTLYDKEKESLKTHKKATMSVAHLPITITVLPALVRTLASKMPSKSIPINCLNIPGLLEEHIEEYSA